MADLYKDTRLRLFGFYDDCDEEHRATLEEMDRVLSDQKAEDEKRYAIWRDERRKQLEEANRS